MYIDIGDGNAVITVVGTYIILVHMANILHRDLRSFEIRFEFESDDSD